MRTLIVGLGNPRMNHTRHNIGSDVLLCVITQFIPKYITQISENLFLLGNNAYFLVMPDLMNISGEKIKHIYDRYKCDQIIVLVDELDLPYGTVKKTLSKGSRGHNGIKSVLNYFNGPIWQVLIGIDRPQFTTYQISSYVLGQLTNEQISQLPKIAYHAWTEIIQIIKKEQGKK